MSKKVIPMLAAAHIVSSKTVEAGVDLDSIISKDDADRGDDNDGGYDSSN